MFDRLQLLAYLSLVFVLAQQVHGQDLVDCYYYDGSIAANNTICPNSRTCCNAQATCTDERLCHNAGDPSNRFIRGPCADNPWNSTGCAAVCLYDESTGVFPRVRQCSDSSWCCDNDASCCENGHGVFLDATGNRVDSLSTSSSATSSTSPTATSTAPAEEATTSTGPRPPETTGLSTGAQAGIGVGVSLGVILVTAIGVATYLMRKKRAKKAAAAAAAAAGGAEMFPTYSDGENKALAPQYAHYASDPSQHTHASEVPGYSTEYKPAAYDQRSASEALASVPGQGHHDIGRFEAEGTTPQLPQELDGRGLGRQ